MRCFIAAEISDATKNAILNAAASLDEKLWRIVKKEHMHITLKFLGEIGNDEIEICKNAINECSKNKFSVELKGGGAFPNIYKGRVIFVNIISEELERIARCVQGNTKGIGDERPFVGHLTVARARKGRINAKKAVELLNEIKIEEWIGKIVLKKSTLTPEGPLHECIYVKNLS